MSKAKWFAVRKPSTSDCLSGYGIATGTVIFPSPKLHVHDAGLHQVVYPVPTLHHCDLQITALLLGHAPHGLWDLRVVQGEFAWRKSATV